MAKKIYDAIVKSEPIDKGFSGDKKYCVTTTDGTKYLLRIIPIEKYETSLGMVLGKDRYAEWQNLFKFLEHLVSLGVPTCNTVELGTCPDGIYVIQSWIHGENLKDVLPELPKTKQYELGVKAGEALRIIHSIPVQENEENWSVRFNRFVDDRIEKYYKSEQNRVKGSEHFIRYINQNRELLENRPQCFLHDDYSAQNMMYESGELRIIDFDRCRFGDPWYEFYKNTFNAQISPHFASGQIHGYFNGEPPQDFFRLLAFYASSQLLTIITYSIPYGWVDSAIKTIDDILKWHDNMNNPVPTWYLKDWRAAK